MERFRALVQSFFGQAGERLSYRRLLMAALATGLLCAGQIDQTIWLVVALAFMGVETAERIISGLRQRPPEVSR